MIEKYYPKRFDWSAVIQYSDNGAPQGNQVIHFISTDKDSTLNPDVAGLLSNELSNARSFDIDAELLRFACEQIALDGLIMEMGVCTGRTINFIAAMNPRKTIYGFDSFAGLPEDWARSDFDSKKGVFGYRDPNMTPPVLHNVCLIKGLFAETLPVFADEILKQQPVAFLHIDCDLYSSTRDIFDVVGHALVPGSMVLFDELYNFEGWQEHEWRALQEFLAKTGKKVEYLGYNRYWEQVLIKFIA